MAQMLEKHDCHEYLDLYKKMGVVFVVNGYRKPKWKTSLEKKENWHPFSNLFFFLATKNLTINQIPCNKHFWKTWFYMLHRFINFYLLLKICGYNIWFSDNVDMYSSHPITKWWLKCSQIWWKKPRKNVSSRPLHLLFLLHVHLTFGRLVCTMGYDTFGMVVNFFNILWEPTTSRKMPICDYNLWLKNNCNQLCN